MSRLEDIDALLTSLGEGATVEEVEFALRDHVGREVLAVVADRAAAGGGGASFPEEWTIGASGSLVIHASESPGAFWPYFQIVDETSAAVFQVVATAAQEPVVQFPGNGIEGAVKFWNSYDDDSFPTLSVNSAAPGAVAFRGQVGFYGTNPIDKPTGVAVTAGGIHAALVSLGLIAA